MSNCSALHCLNQIASFLKVSIGKIILDTDGIPVRTVNNLNTKGFVAIILELIKQQGDTSFHVSSLLDTAELRQWLEYAVVYALRADDSTQMTQVLKELNGVLSTKTYLVSSKVTVADIVLYYILYHVIVNLSYLDKEKYIHLSRWFDNLQQDATVRQNNKLVTFNTNYLATMVPAKH